MSPTSKVIVQVRIRPKFTGEIVHDDEPVIRQVHDLTELVGNVSILTLNAMRASPGTVTMPRAQSVSLLFASNPDQCAHVNGL